MPRSLWSGALSFGLVNVPVKVVSAVSQKKITFHQIHEKDGGRIRYKRVCEAEDKEVPYEEIAKMTDEGGPPVMFTKEEIAAAEAEKSDLIEILDFVKIEEVDPLYFEKPYYLLPDKGGDKAYRLLVEAMTNTKRVAVAKFIMRSKERLVAIRPVDHALTLTTLNYGDEVILPKDMEGVPESVKVNKKEVDMAERLVSELSTEFDPGKYRDEHRMRLLDLIEAKREGGIVMPMPKAKAAATGDLASALEASLKAIRERQKGGEAEA